MKVLLIEDDEFMLMLFSSFLTDEGFEVTGRTSATDALEAYQAEFFPLVITDIVMPGMDGLELCRRIRQLPQGEYTVILGVTAHESPEMLQAVLSAGADDYLPKPNLTNDTDVRLLEIRLEVAARQVQNTLERKKAEEALRKSELRLREANATKDKFFSIIAHDLKGPFSGLLPMTEIMIDYLSDVDPELKAIAVNIRLATLNTQKLLENLLDWARLQRDQIEYKPGQVNLTEIVKTNVDLFQETARQKQIRLYHTAADNISVFADDKMITTVIRNLVNNAVKFTRPDGEICIEARPVDSGTIEITIRDSGVGIDEKGLKKLFRIDESLKTVGTSGEKGTGLGLILCREFVEKNGGRIWVESEVGIGSKFKFTLPVQKPVTNETSE